MEENPNHKSYLKSEDDKKNGGFFRYLLPLANHIMNTLRAALSSVTSSLVPAQPSSSSSPVSPAEDECLKSVLPKSRSLKPKKRNVNGYRDRVNNTRSPLQNFLLLFLSLFNKLLAHISRGRGAKLSTYPSPLMLLLILSLFGRAEARTGDRIYPVHHVNTHLFFLIMAAVAIRWFCLVYLPGVARHNAIYRQESDTSSTHTILIPPNPPNSMSLVCQNGTMYPQCLNPDPVQCSSETTERSSYSYSANPTFHHATILFGGGNSEIALLHPSHTAVEVRKTENLPIPSEMVSSNALPHPVEETERQGSNEMTFSGNLGLGVNVRISCGSCDYDLHSSNVNVESIEATPLLEEISPEEDVNEDELFVGVQEQQR